MSITQALRQKIGEKILPTSGFLDQKVAVMGTKRAGKTTSLGLIQLTCVNLANNPKYNFFFRVIEHSTGIRGVASKLRSGKFPEETPMDALFEADLIMKWKSVTGSRKVILPFVESAGEEVQKMIKRFSEGAYDLDPKHFRHATELHEKILQSNGFIIIVPVTRAQLVEGKKLIPILEHDTEPEGTFEDPDVNISRLLDCIYEYKERRNSPPVKAIAVVLTKYDLLQPFLIEKGMDLTQQTGVTKFMNLYFPETHAILKFYGIEQVRFFPSWVDLHQDREGNYVQWPDGSYRIKVLRDRRIPYYAEQPYIDLVEWVRTNFAS